MLRSNTGFSNVFREFERMRQEMDRVFEPWGLPLSIRAEAHGAFPLVNVGSDKDALYVDAFVPGVEAAKLDVTVNDRVLTISGERPDLAPKEGVWLRERSTGHFSRSITLPDDVELNRIEANYRDGVLRVRIERREEVKPRRIEIQ
jgi:HSP20 family protein